LILRIKRQMRSASIVSSTPQARPGSASDVADRKLLAQVIEQIGAIAGKLGRDRNFGKL
jgi:hypothetical protein